MEYKPSKRLLEQLQDILLDLDTAENIIELIKYDIENQRQDKIIKKLNEELKRIKDEQKN